MSVIQRQILFGLMISVLLFIGLSIVFFLAFPLEDWSLIWTRKIMDLPFVMVVPTLSLLIGIGAGLFSGISWSRQFKSVKEELTQVLSGHIAKKKEPIKITELASIEQQVDRVKNHIIEQTKLSQKLATEKAEDQEKRIQEIVSQERNRLARELHDSVSQQLFAASMMMSAITEYPRPADSPETKQLKMVEQMIQQSQLEMRALLLHLRPAALKGKSLEEGIRELLEELVQKVPMDIQWKVEPLELDKGIEDHLFRILQESVSNTLRHSKASSLDVLLIERDQLIILRISDNGVGFNVEKEKAGSYGLQNMHERALEIGGTLKIVSLQNKGTRLEVRVPKITIEGDNHD
ncbi:sensor histidine kinase [Falsibacillus pallidus]|uniref:Sensor histidine kinase n=1 Tax=Falsibacillus pallidus TaxID=493781 RepID=A0A370GF42_9BACI|nr:sensor histidine kinase [Falsibacillus pallidus]RDI42291.1 NarL family two-component system sensor histidine kinase LiaS [Falsibacillus pallidus]